MSDLNTYLMLVLAVLSVGDSIAGTIGALETHSIKSAISKRGLLDKLKIYICLLSLWIGVDIMSFVVNADELKLAMTGFVIIAIVNEINSLTELLGGKYKVVSKELTKDLEDKENENGRR